MLLLEKKWFKINNLKNQLSFHLKKLEKEEQIKPQVSRMNKIIEPTAEIKRKKPAEQ